MQAHHSDSRNWLSTWTTYGPYLYTGKTPRLVNGESRVNLGSDISTILDLQEILSGMSIVNHAFVDIKQVND